MTDPESLEANQPRRSTLPRRPGLWRMVSLLVVIAALIVSALSVLQSRSSSNVALQTRATVLLENINVTATDLPVAEGAEIAVLGLVDGESRQGFDPAGTSVEVPIAAYALLGLYNSDQALVGLAIAESAETDDTRPDVVISAESTANALLFLSPAMLRPDFRATAANVAVIEVDPAFGKLTDAIRANPVLSASNPGVELALAEIADRTPVKRPAPDQGCDSVFASDAYPSAGTCVQPKSNGLLVTNEQDRWALLYDGTPGFADLCAVVSPTSLDGSEVIVPYDGCDGEALVAAPGPIVNQGEGQSTIDERVRTATAVNALYSYVGPFAELAATSSGFTALSVNHIDEYATDITSSLSLLLESNQQLRDAMDVATTASTAQERHTAAITAARAIVEAADSTTLIPQRAASDSRHLDLLDLYERSGERMTSTRTDWRWEADAIGRANFGVGQ